jgi:hypothetical protein
MVRRMMQRFMIVSIWMMIMMVRKTMKRIMMVQHCEIKPKFTCMGAFSAKSWCRYVIYGKKPNAGLGFVEKTYKKYKKKYNTVLVQLEECVKLISIYFCCA